MRFDTSGRPDFDSAGVGISTATAQSLPRPRIGSVVLIMAVVAIEATLWFPIETERFGFLAPLVLIPFIVLYGFAQGVKGAEAPDIPLDSILQANNGTGKIGDPRNHAGGRGSAS